MKLFSAAVQQHDHACDDERDRPPLPKKRPDLRDQAEIRQEKKNTHHNQDQSTETGSHRPYVSYCATNSTRRFLARPSSLVWEVTLLLSSFSFPRAIAVAMIAIATLALVFFFGVFPHMLMVVVVGVLRIQSDADVGSHAGSREMSWQ